MTSSQVLILIHGLTILIFNIGGWALLIYVYRLMRKYK